METFCLESQFATSAYPRKNPSSLYSLPTSIMSRIALALALFGAVVSATELSECQKERRTLYEQECIRLGLPCDGVRAINNRANWENPEDSSLACDDDSDEEFDAPAHSFLNSSCGAYNKALTPEGVKRAMLIISTLIDEHPDIVSIILATVDEQEQLLGARHHQKTKALRELYDVMRKNAEELQILCDIVHQATAIAQELIVTPCHSSRRHFLFRECSDMNARCGHDGLRIFGHDEKSFRKVIGRHIIANQAEVCSVEKVEREQDEFSCGNQKKVLSVEGGRRITLLRDYLMVLRPQVVASAVLTENELSKYMEASAPKASTMLAKAYERAAKKADGGEIEVLCILRHAVLSANNIAYGHK